MLVTITRSGSVGSTLTFCPNLRTSPSDEVIRRSRSRVPSR